VNLPLWIRRLPHNLSTIGFGRRLRVDWFWWTLVPVIVPFFKANKGDENYPFHFEETGLLFLFGPFELFIGLVDTPEENAWIP